MGQLISTASTLDDQEWNPTPVDIQLTRLILVRGCGLPVEIASQILTLAEYWATDRLVHDSQITIFNTRRVLIVVNDVLSDLRYVALVRLEDPSESGRELRSCNQAHGKIERIEWTVTSHDQGWSSYPADHGTFRNSWTWFEAAVFQSRQRSPDGHEGENGLQWHQICVNLHARSAFTTHEVAWLPDHPFIDQLKQMLIESGASDTPTRVGIKIRAVAQFPGWANTVKELHCRIKYAF